MAIAYFRFYGDLNDFLPPDRQHQYIEYSFERRAAIKDVIEALDVPHTEVDVIVVHDASVGFDYILRDRDRVAGFPWTLDADVDSPRHLRPRPPPCPCFVLDAHLGKLARYLRLLGFDTRYRNDYDDQELAVCADEEHRVLLTRDRDLLKRKRVSLAHFVRADDPWQQLEEICDHLGLHSGFAPFTRCAHCNGTLRPVDKAQVIDQLEPKTKRYYNHFLQCDTCAQIYWEGSHVNRMQALIKRLGQHRKEPPR